MLSVRCHRRCSIRDRMSPVPLVLPSNPDLHRIYTRVVAVHLQ